MATSAESVFREIAVELTKKLQRQFYSRTSKWLTRGGKINLGSGTGGFTGVLPIPQGGTGTDVGFKDHSHDGTREQGQKLIQGNTHEDVDTDSSASALHHTLGDDNFQAAPGNHPLVGSNHTVSGLTEGDVLTATSPTTYAFQTPANSRGSAWQILTTGPSDDPQIVFASGQAVMIEILR